MKKMYLDNLIKQKSQTDWKANVGNKISFVYGDVKGEVQIINYDGQYLTVKYLDKEPIKMQTSNFRQCRLGKLLGSHTLDFKIEIGATIKDEKRDLAITDREYRQDLNSKNQKWYKYTCNKCGWTEGWIIEGNLMSSKQGCSCCSGMIVVEHINSIVADKETHWMIPCFQGGYDEAKLYTKCSIKEIQSKCPICGKVKDKITSIRNIYRNHSIDCYCNK